MISLSTSSLVLLVLPLVAKSFSVAPTWARTASTTRLTAQPGNGDGEEDPGLILSDLDSQLGQMKSKYPTSEADFLAAARQRAAEKKASVDSGANDDDWKRLAAEKEEKFGTIDDWENSQKEAGNADSQILMFTEPEGGEDEDGEDPEPKLMLF